jgi:hypothetical protein
MAEREDGERTVDAFGALACERQLEPERDGTECDGHPDGRIAGRRERPVQRSPHIADVMLMALQPLGGGAGFPIDLRPLERSLVVVGVCARDAITLPAFLELAERIGPGDIEEPIKGNRAADIGPDE